MTDVPATAAPAAGAVDDDARERTARLILAATIAVFVVAMAVQLAGDAYLRGDGSYYLRDAARFADGHLPQSRYSPGFAFLLAPILMLLGDNYTVAGSVTIALNMVFSVVAFGLLYRFLRTWLEPILAATSVAVFALSQGVVTYFAEVRPEALCLLLLTGMLLALKGGRPWLGVALGGLVMLVRIAVAPLVLVTLAVFLRRRPKLLAATAALFVVAAVAYLATQSPTDQSYLEVGGKSYQPHGGATGRVGALLRPVGVGVVHYVQFGLPRLAVPFRVLNTGLGPIIGVGVTGAMAGGAIMLLRRRPVSRALLVSTVAGFGIYLPTLIGWPVRSLAAVRLITPAPVVPMLGLATAAAWVGGRLFPGRRRAAVVTIMGLVAFMSAAGSVSAISDHINDGEVGRKSFVAAHEAARGRFPPGRLISSRPGASELLTGVRAVGYPIRRDVDEFARKVQVCAAVLSPDSSEEAAAWVELYRGRTLASVAGTEVVAVIRPWCPDRS